MDRLEFEQQVLAAEELARRRETDPWWNWRPTPRQRAYIEAVYGREVAEAWFIAANRSGKSDVAAYVGAGLARFGRHVPLWTTGGDFHPTKGWVVSASHPASRTVIQPKYFNNGMGQVESHAPFIPDREIDSFNQNDQLLKLKCGSLIEFKTAEAKTLTLAGAGLDWIQIDEELPKEKYNELIIRVGGGRKLLVFGACTLLPPEGEIGGVSWMYAEKIKPWLGAGGTETRRPQNWSAPYELFGASIYDNPHLLPSEIARLEAIYPGGSIERQIRLEGLWLPGVQGSRAYTSFDGRIHVKAVGPLVPRRPVCWVWDFNVEPMVSLIGQRIDGIFRVHKELILEQGDLSTMVQFFVESVPYHTGEVWIYGDATGRNRNASAPGGRSEYQIIQNEMRTYGCPVRLKVAESNPNVPDRINAVNRAFRDEQGVSHIEIDPSCKELIDDFEQVLRDNKGGIQKSRKRGDFYYRRTHTSDAFGYWVNYEEPVRSTTLREKVMAVMKQPAYAFGRGKA